MFVVRCVCGVLFAALVACDGSYPDCAGRGELFNAQGQCGQACSDGGGCPDGQVCVASQQCVDPHSNCTAFQFVCSAPQ